MLADGSTARREDAVGLVLALQAMPLREEIRLVRCRVGNIVFVLMVLDLLSSGKRERDLRTSGGIAFAQ